MARDFGITNLQRAAVAPSNPLAGDTYYDTSSGRPFFFDGTLWQPLGGAAQAISTLNFSLTGNIGVSNAAAGTQLPLVGNEQQGGDVIVVGGNVLQFNTPGTYHVVFNLTMSSTVAGWFILMANLPGGVRKMVVGACTATPWFDEATISFHITAAASDQVWFSVQASAATGLTADARSVGSATKVAVGPGPTGPQGPAGPSGSSYLGSPVGIICSGPLLATPAVNAVFPIATVINGSPSWLAANTVTIPANLGGLYDIRAQIAINNANAIGVPMCGVRDSANNNLGMEFAWIGGTWSGTQQYTGSWHRQMAGGDTLQVRYGTTGGPTTVGVTRLSVVRLADALATA